MTTSETLKQKLDEINSVIYDENIKINICKNCINSYNPWLTRENCPEISCKLYKNVCIQSVIDGSKTYYKNNLRLKLLQPTPYTYKLCKEININGKCKQFEKKISKIVLFKNCLLCFVIFSLKVSIKILEKLVMEKS